MSQYHDTYFRKNLDPALAADLLTFFYGDLLAAEIDLGGLKPYPIDMIDEQHQRTASDTAFSTQFRRHPAMLYFLIEHKSEGASKNTRLPLVLQVPKQKLRLLEKVYAEERKLVKVFPIAFYHGSGPYKGRRAISEALDYVDAELLDGIDTNELMLIDLNDLDEVKLAGKPKLQLFLMVLRHYYRDDLLTKMGDLFEVMVELEKRGEGSFIESTFRYLYENHLIKNKENIDQIALNLPEKIRGEVMSVADQLRAENTEKVQTANALRMIQEGFSPELIARMLNMPQEKVTQLKHGISA